MKTAKLIKKLVIILSIIDVFVAIGIGNYIGDYLLDSSIASFLFTILAMVSLFTKNTLITGFAEIVENSSKSEKTKIEEEKKREADFSKQVIANDKTNAQNIKAYQEEDADSTLTDEEIEAELNQGNKK